MSATLTPQALYSTFSKSDSLAPAATAGAVSAALFTASRLGRLPDAMKPLMRNLLGWTATLLFMFQPLAQLVRMALTLLHCRRRQTRPPVRPLPQAAD